MCNQIQFCERVNCAVVSEQFEEDTWSGPPFLNPDLVLRAKRNLSYTDARPLQVGSTTSSIVLDTKRGERALLIKNSRGDWGIVKGHWAGFSKEKLGKGNATCAALSVQKRNSVQVWWT